MDGERGKVKKEGGKVERESKGVGRKRGEVMGESGKEKREKRKG